tara:strand:- start:123 stop:251 length:129 start_codon:yes stop_codon:yes gene_type:complete
LCFTLLAAAVVQAELVRVPPPVLVVAVAEVLDYVCVHLQPPL